jgi:hypothetical protein
MRRYRKAKVVLDPALQARLRTYVSLLGEREASERLGLSTQTLARGCAGFALHEGNARLIELGLADSWKVEKVAE